MTQQSHTLTLACGCLVYVSCHPRTGVAHTRVIERRGTTCGYRQHDVGTRLWLWEMLPETTVHVQPESPTSPRPLHQKP